MWIHGVNETHNNCLELIKPQNAHKKVAPYLDMCGRAFFFIFIEDHISDSGWCILCLHCTGEYCIMMSNMIVQRLPYLFHHDDPFLCDFICEDIEKFLPITIYNAVQHLSIHSLVAVFCFYPPDCSTYFCWFQGAEVIRTLGKKEPINNLHGDDSVLVPAYCLVVSYLWA